MTMAFGAKLRLLGVLCFQYPPWCRLLGRLQSQCTRALEPRDVVTLGRYACNEFLQQTWTQTRDLLEATCHEIRYCTQNGSRPIQRFFHKMSFPAHH